METTTRRYEFTSNGSSSIIDDSGGILYLDTGLTPIYFVAISCTDITITGGAESESVMVTFDTELYPGSELPFLSRVLAGESASTLSIKINEIKSDGIATPSEAFIFGGDMVSFKLDGSVIEAKFESNLRSANEEYTCRKTGTECPYSLYSKQCGVSLSSNTSLHTVSSVSSKVIAIASLSNDNEKLKLGGYVEFNGYKHSIIAANFDPIDNLNTTITVGKPIPGLISGSIVSIVNGCDLTQTSCEINFNNKLRFGGFPFVPIKSK